ncbi:metal-binding protein [Tumebacillus algifaecis]|uniref:Metal-binding protein n=1 Tax=Tumebacillus algifaecis TaxID=1214604 RepID=A0A223D6E2_9BACL|nr:metal-binding protein [Tumebacillus algifaecis]
MKIHTFVLGMFQENCYLLVDEATNQAVIVDPGQDPDEVIAAIKGLDVVGIWITHAHLDHIAGLREVKAAAPNAKVMIHEVEKDWLTDPLLNGSARYPDYIDPIDGPGADVLLKHGDSVTLGEHKMEVRFAPGHSPGHVVFVGDGFVLAGDTLFNNGIGRTDLPGGDTAQLIQSIREQLYTLPEDTTVYSGHGPTTTIGRERQSNWAVNDKSDLLSGGPNVQWT